ncbi:MAG: dihydropteroate synthase [Bacteriovoracaceae bacterium]|nr:dihydropteroate synthase [Bacteriovoracaceae bacterium]
MYSFDNIKMMGVINITPDSFSDGGIFNTKAALKKQIDTFNDWTASIIDIGAESTAPFNDPITKEEEIERFKEIFIPVLNEYGKDLTNTTISIDTYRAATFHYIYKQIKKINPAIKLIWNDVSGVIDEQLKDMLLGSCPDVQYVFCHNLCPSSELASSHMDNPMDCDPKSVVAALKDYFQKAQKQFDDWKIAHRIIFDPCFGFSKTVPQNLQLIKDLPSLLFSFDRKIPWLLGISRKSFLKKSIIKASPDSSIQVQTEYLHTHILAAWTLKANGYNLIYRVHDPAVFYNALKGAILCP